MKKILVMLATDPSEDGKLGQRHYIRDEYASRLYERELIPCFVTNFSPRAVLSQIYAECSGLLFPGGKDVNPELYGAECHPKTKAGGREGDALELDLIRQAVEDRKPLFGVCRGMQLINVALGGTLHQHIGDLGLEIDHGGKGEGLPYDLLPECSHEIIIDPDSQFFQIVGAERVAVSSGHHQVVHDLGENLKVVARCPHGLAEALEHQDPDRFVLAVQSHPEMMGDDFTEKLFGAFRRAVVGEKVEGVY